MMTVPNPAKELILLAEEGVLVEGETASGNGGIAGDDSGVVEIAGDIEGDDATGALLGAVVLDGGGDETGEVTGEGVDDGVPGAAAGPCGGDGGGGTAAGAGADAPGVVVVITIFIPLSQCPCDPQMKYLFPEEERVMTVIPPLYDPTGLFV